MTWQYRVIKRGSGEVGITEAYESRTKANVIGSVTVDNVAPVADNVASLRWQLVQMLLATYKPVLVDDGKDGIRLGMGERGNQLREMKEAIIDLMELFLEDPCCEEDGSGEERLDEEADKTGEPRSEVMRRLIRLGIEQEGIANEGRE